MAVFTSLTEKQLQEFLSRYENLSLQSFQGIEQGLENSNYFIECQGETPQRYVLSILEQLNQQQAEFQLHILTTFTEYGIAVAKPVADKKGTILQLVKGKPAILSQFIPGQHSIAPSVRQCEVIGNLLADLHLASANIIQDNPSQCDKECFEQEIYQASAYLTEAEKTLVSQTLQDYLAIESDAMPFGLIHGDVFRDNVLFEGDELTGILDFYSANDGFLLFDIAVAVNDWCRTNEGMLDEQRYEALTSAYLLKRPWTASEVEYWPVILRAAAMRFWLSRLLAQHQLGEQGRFVSKDPNEFKQLYFNYLVEEQSQQKLAIN